MPGAFARRLAAAGLDPGSSAQEHSPDAQEPERAELGSEAERREPAPEAERAEPAPRLAPPEPALEPEEAAPALHPGRAELASSDAGAAQMPPGAVCWVVVYKPFVPVRETPSTAAKMLYFKQQGELVWSKGEPDAAGWIEVPCLTDARGVTSRGGWMLTEKPGMGTLLERSPGPAADMGESPLALAVRDGDLRQVMGLLDQGADPNSADTLGETPLFEAVASGNLDVTAALLLRGADPLVRSPCGAVARDQAEGGCMEALLVLFQGEEPDVAASNALFEGLGSQIQRGMMLHMQERQAMREMEAMRAHGERRQLAAEGRPQGSAEEG